MAKDLKAFVKAHKEEKLKKRAPEGVDPEKHERCVQEVKRQGHDVGSAHAICTSAMKKDLATSNVDCGTGLAGKICRHNNAKLNKANELETGKKIEAEHAETIKQIVADVKAGKVKPFEEYFKDIAEDHIAEIKDYYTRLVAMESEAKKEGVKKSYDYPDLKVRVDTNDHQAAELTAHPALVEHLKKNYMDLQLGESKDLEIPNGKLTLYKKAEGLFSGHVTRAEDGDIVEKLDDQSLEMVAKNLEFKNLIQKEYLDSLVEVNENPIISEPVIAITPNAENGPSYLRIKCGDFELELKKSVRAFISNFKKSQSYDKEILKKAMCIWREKTPTHLPNNAAAAKELLDNWDLHKEEFNQIIFAIEQIKKDHE